MSKDFIEEVHVGIPGKLTRYTFSTKCKDVKGHEILPQVVVIIKQEHNLVKLDRIQIEGLYEIVKKRQDKLNE